MGIDAQLGTKGDSEDRGTVFADFRKDWALKAISEPMQVDGGNTSVRPETGQTQQAYKPEYGKDPNDYSQLGPAWCIPLQINAYMYEKGGPVNNFAGDNYITAPIYCPRQKFKDVCRLIGAIFSLGTSILAVGAPSIEAGYLGVFGAAGGVGFAGCSYAIS